MVFDNENGLARIKALSFLAELKPILIDSSSPRQFPEKCLSRCSTWPTRYRSEKLRKSLETSAVSYVTLSFLTIYAVFLIGIELARLNNVKGIFPGIVAVMSLTADDIGFNSAKKLSALILAKPFSLSNTIAENKGGVLWKTALWENLRKFLVTLRRRSIHFVTSW
jgi:hypothetical protein